MKQPPRKTQTQAAFGPGKVILLGEHAVVYGYPAVAAPLSWGVTASAKPARRCDLVLPKTVKGRGRDVLKAAFARAAKLCGNPKVQVHLESDLPVSMGLGSSAAVAVACSRILLQAAHRPAPGKTVLKLALEMEREFHGTPSGVDHTCSALGEPILYRRPAVDVAPRVRILHARRPLKLLVALVGTRSPTSQTVGALRLRTKTWPRRYGRLFREMGRVAQDGAVALESGDLDALGDAMNANHGLLCAVGVSSQGLDEMVHRLRAMGALGAKLTGAGGDGGAVIGLFLEPEPAVARLTRLGVRCFSSQVAGPRAL